MLDEKDADLLVIDADDRTRPASESWMQSQGYDGHCLPDGWSAVRFLETYQPRFAVVDLATLGDGSLDVLELIRRAPRLRDLSLLVHVAVPEASGGGIRSRAFLTRGIDWPSMRAEADRFVN